MRIVGRLRLFESADATTPVNAKVRWGIAWLPAAIVGQADGDSSIPDPGSALREALWIQTGTLLGLEYDSETNLGTGATLAPIETALIDLDITQMRKQPTLEHELALVWKCLSSVESGTVGLEYEGKVMLALP